MISRKILLIAIGVLLLSIVSYGQDETTPVQLLSQALKLLSNSVQSIINIATRLVSFGGGIVSSTINPVLKQSTALVNEITNLASPFDLQIEALRQFIVNLTAGVEKLVTSTVERIEIAADNLATANSRRSQRGLTNQIQRLVKTFGYIIKTLTGTVATIQTSSVEQVNDIIARYLEIMFDLASKNNDVLCGIMKRDGTPSSLKTNLQHTRDLLFSFIKALRRPNCLSDACNELNNNIEYFLENPECRSLP